MNAVSKRWNKKSNSIDSGFEIKNFDQEERWIRVLELNLEKIMSEEEKKEFYATIGYEGEDISTSTYPEQYVDIDVTIRLLLLDLNIWSKINENDREYVQRFG